MSAYDNDPRVTANNDGSFTVNCDDGSVALVRRFDDDWWEVPPRDGSRRTDMHAKLDRAFRSLIGDPR